MKKLIQILFFFLLSFQYVQNWCFNTSIPNPASGNIYSITFSPDDKYFVAGHYSGQVTKWRTSTLTIVATYTLGLSGTYRVTYSNDGNYIAIGSNLIGTVTILNAQTFTLNTTISTGWTLADGLDFRYDSQMLLICGNSGNMKIYRVSDWTLNTTIITSSTNKLLSCKYSKDNKIAVVGLHYYGTFDNLGNPIFQDNSIWWYNRVAIKNDSTYFIAANTNGYFIQSDWNTGSLINYPYAAGVEDCDYSQNGIQFAIATLNGKIFIYNSVNRINTLIQTLVTGTNNIVSGLKYSNYGHYLMAGDQNTGIIYQWFNLSQYYYGNCTEICGDFITWYFPCDNQIGVLYDGCDDHCQVMANFVCPKNQMDTYCSYSGTINISLISVKNINQSTSGIYQMTILITPPLYVFQLCESDQLKPIFQMTNGEIIDVKYNKDINQFYLTLKPTTNINLYNQFQITYTPTKSSRRQFFAGQKQSFKFKQVTMFYNDQKLGSTKKSIQIWCYILAVIGWIACILGIYYKKLQAIQAINVLQFCWINLTYVQSYFTIIYQIIQPLKYLVGFNYSFVKQINVDVENLIFTQQFALDQKLLSNNFNLSLILLGIPFLLLIIILIYSLVKKYKKQNQNQSSQQQKLISQKSLKKIYCIICQILMTFVMNIIIYFTFCSVIYFKYASLSDIGSNFIFAFTLLIIIFTFSLFYLSKNSFGYFKTSFHKDTKLQYNHYFIYFFTLILSSFLTGMFPTLFYLSGIPILLLLIYIGFNRPYKMFMDNIRQGYNLVIMLGSLGVKFYFKNTQISQLNSIKTYVCLIILVFIGFTSVFVFSFMSILSNVFSKDKKIIVDQSVTISELQQNRKAPQNNIIKLQNKKKQDIKKRQRRKTIKQVFKSQVKLTEQQFIFQYSENKNKNKLNQTNKSNFLSQQTKQEPYIVEYIDQITGKSIKKNSFDSVNISQNYLSLQRKRSIQTQPTLKRKA